MKILYAIQGTGNGHLSRARDVIPALNKFCETDILVSGYQADVKLPFKIDHQYRGLSFIFGKKGGIDMWNTYIEANLKKLRKEIKSVPVENYDFVINDFEPVSAWSCYQKRVPCISLSHQAAVLHKNAPQPKNQDLFGKFVLKNYAPSNIQFGFHFSRYASNIFTPVIRKEIREAKVKDKGHFTVYLPAYSDEKLIKMLSQIKKANWHVFSKHTKKGGSYGNIEIMPINNEHYIDSFRKSSGLLCGAGFEGPAEALHMGKKLLVIPMKAQYEQMCNATALKNLGVPVIKKLKESKLDKIQSWIDTDYRLQVEYPDITDQVIKQIFEGQVLELLKKNNWNTQFNLKYPGDSASKEELQRQL
jgi:uncharacterized protein (TIGR00661 family)